MGQEVSSGVSNTAESVRYGEDSGFSPGESC